MRLEHLIFFKNLKTQYGVMHHFRESLCRALTKRNIHVTVVDASENSSLMSLIYQNPPDCTFAFNGLRSLDGKRFLADILEIPHVAWLLDAAHYFSEMARSPFNIIITPDQTSMHTMRHLGSPHAFFLPHAFDASLTTEPGGDRFYPIVFLGSLMDYLDVEEVWAKSLSKKLMDALIEAAEQVLSTSSLTVSEALKRVLEQFPEGFESLEKKEELENSFDYYIRAKGRIRLLQALKGLPLHIFGNSLSRRSWRDFLDLNQGAYSIHPGVGFSQAITIMKKTGILLNSSPMFKTGAHERIFYGLGLGAAVLTNETPWLNHHFKVDDEILAYPASKPSDVVTKISRLLENPSEIASLARKGQQKVLKEHTWDVRADQLIHILEKELESFHE